MFRSMDSNQAHSLSPQVPGVKQIPFFSPTGQRMIQRHPLNDRRQDQVLQEYIRSVESKGIVRGVRGDAWVCAACDPKDPARGDSTYWALTFATLTLASNLFTQKVPQDMQHVVLHEYSIHGWKYIDTCWICKHNPQSVAKLKLEIHHFLSLTHLEFLKSLLANGETVKVNGAQISQSTGGL